MGHFQLFSMILKFSMGHFLSFYTDFHGPFPKLMGLWRMAPCLPNHWGGVYKNHPVCLSVQSKLNLGNNFRTKRDRAFILHSYILYFL